MESGKVDSQSREVAGISNDREKEILYKLNDRQRQAVTSPINENIQVVAGAGTGKTSVLTQRIAWLIAHGVQPWKITAVTFTNKAAQEMRDRLEKSVGAESAKRVQMGTFHGIALRILRKYADILGVDKNFQVLDKDEQKILMVRAIAKLFGPDSSINRKKAFLEENNGKQLENWQKDTIKKQKEKELSKFYQISAEIDSWKQDGLYPVAKVEEYLKSSGQSLSRHREALQVYAWYEEEKKKHGGMDFDDLILRLNQLLSSHHDIRQIEQSRIQYLFSDEFQDVNKPQADLLLYLSGNSELDQNQTAHVFIVGDADQSIYGWRGSRPEMMSLFASKLHMKKVMLEQNYRCSSVVLEAANSVISNNEGREDKNLFTTRSDALPITVFHADKIEKTEERWVADLIQDMFRSKKSRYSDIAVLYRNKYMAYALTRELIKRGIPYKVFGDTDFYSCKEIKDGVAWLRVVSNPNDNTAISRAIENPPCGIGSKTIDGIYNRAEKLGQSIYQVLTSEYGASASKAVSPFLRKIERLRTNYKNMPFGDFVGSVIRYQDEDYPSRLSLFDYHEKDGEKGEQRANNLLSLISYAESFSSMQQMGTNVGYSPEESLAQHPGDTLSEFVTEIALMTATELADNQGRNAVNLMTIHRAKGLEFSNVFIIGCVEDHFPMKHNGEIGNLEEERRLFYVAVTRAIKSLWIAGPKYPNYFGNFSLSPTDISRFVREIPEHLIGNSASEVMANLQLHSPIADRMLLASNASNCPEKPDSSPVTDDAALNNTDENDLQSLIDYANFTPEYLSDAD